MSQPRLPHPAYSKHFVNNLPSREPSLNITRISMLRRKSTTIIAIWGALFITYILFFRSPPLPSTSNPSSYEMPFLSDIGTRPFADSLPEPQVKDDWNPDPTKLFFGYGSISCIPQIPASLILKAQSLRKSCEIHSPFNLTSPSPRIAVLTAHFGSNTEYQPALETHLLHGLIHGHEVHVLCDPIVDKLWNKPAFLLKVTMDQMLKPESERLDWSMWADRDTLILDQCRPISSFLPSLSSPSSIDVQETKPGLLTNLAIALHLPFFSEPKAAHEKVPQLIVSNDKNGLNNGIFLLRISPTALSLLIAILSHPTYRPKTRLRFTEQTAMALLAKSPTFRSCTYIVPQYWFNSYTYMDRNEKGNNLGYITTNVGGDIDSGARVFANRANTTGLEGGFRDGYVRRGDFLVHFAGNVNKGQNVERWMKMLDEEGIVWKSKGGVQRDVTTEVAEFWRKAGV
jgi:mannan polymerase II complex MNN10 subunit